MGEEQIREVRAGLEKEEKMEREFGIAVRDESGELVAEVKKVIHFRKVQKSKSGTAGR